MHVHVTVACSDHSSTLKNKLLGGMEDMTVVFVILSTLVLHACFAYSLDDYILKVEPRCGKSVKGNNPTLHVLSDHSVSVTARCENGNQDFTTAEGVQYKLDASFTSGNNRCKMKKIVGSNSYKVVVIVKYETGEAILEVGRREFTLTCTFDQYGSQISPSHRILDSEESTGRVEVNAGLTINRKFFSVVFTNVLGQSINGPVLLNKKIAMVATSNGANGEVGLRPVNCDAVGRLRKAKYAVLRAGCGDGIVFPKTSGFLTRGRTVRSPYFKGFHLEGDSNLSFECSFILCTSNCDGDSCAIACGTPKTVKHTRKVYKTTTVNSIARYRCLPGYTQTGSGLSICRTGNKWSIPAISCKIVDCKSPWKVANSKVRYSTTTYGSVVMYTCNVGYKAVGSSSRSSCSANGRWTRPTMKCIAIGRRCRKLPSLPHMTSTYSSTAYGSVAVFKCIRGYIQTGPGISTCARNGFWNRPVIACRVVDCSTLRWRIPNSRVQYKSTTYNSVASYSCNPGYRASGRSRKSYCQAKGKWTRPSLTCTVKDCKKPGVLVPNTYVKFSSTTYGEKAVIICKKGFIQTGNGLSTCRANGKWSVPKTSCKIRNCKKPPVLPHMTAKYSSTTYGSVAVFKCIKGYKQVGRGLSTCAANGYWNRPFIACRVVDCSIPTLRIANTKVRFLQTTYKSVASYTCDAGYSAVGNSKSYCSASGKWTKPDLKCAASGCGTPKISTPNLIVKINGQKVGSTGTVSCKKGYVQKGKGTITCKSSGKWSQPAVTCTPVNCGKIPKRGNTRPVYTSTTYKSSVRYFCLPGYRGNKASNLVTCQANGKWSKLGLVCKVVNCGKLPTLGNARSLYSSTTYRSAARYVCRPGYLGNKASNLIICQANGRWSRLRHACQAVDCGKIPRSANSRYFYTSTKYKSTIRYFCLPGYRSNRASNLVTCQANGKWSTLRHACKAVNCGKIPAISNTRPRYSKTTYRSRVTYSCSPGFLPNKASNFAVCQSNGKWTIPKLKCTTVTCGVPPKLKISNAKLIVKGTSYQSSATIKCAKGYTLRGSSKITCTMSGKWTTPKATCAVTNCGRAPAVANSKPFYSKTIYKSTLKYYCLPGYRANKAFGSSVCQANGKWSPSGLVCKAVNCGKIPAISNTRPRYSKTTYRSRVTYSCSPGYLPNKASNFAVCQSNGKWTIPKLKCTIRNCGTPKTTVGNSNVIFKMTTFRSSATVTCNKGYIQKGAGRMRCGADGRWTKPVITCSPVNCGRVPLVTNGRASYKTTIFKSTVIYSCMLGYYGNKARNSATCQDNGKWSTVPLRCSPVNCGKVVNVPNSKPVFKLTTYKSTVSYICNHGFMNSLPRDKSTCQATGAWSKPLLRCMGSVCGVPPKINFSNLQIRSTKLLGTAVYSCMKGYKRVKGSGNIRCLATKKWAIATLVCKIHDCKTPKFKVPNTVLKLKGTVYKSVARYSCLERFDQIGPGTSKCQSDGTWSKPVITCKIINCGKIPVVANSSPSYKSTVYKSTVQYTCVKGYVGNKGTNSAVCQRNGTWTSPKLVCSVVNCGKVPNIANSKASYTKTVYKSTVKYACQAIYLANKGSNSVICQANGKWSSTTFKCRLPDCKVPPNLPNMKVNVKKTTYGSTATYYCNFGYKQEGSVMSKCGADGKWQKPKLKCTLSVCGVPLRVKDADLVFKKGGLAEFTCKTGFKAAKGGGGIRCLKNKKWTKSNLICKVIDCGKIPIIANSKASYKSSVYNSEVVYACKNGYKLNNKASNKAVCQANGKWSLPKITCEASACGIPPTIKFTDSTIKSTNINGLAQYTCMKGYEVASGSGTIKCQASKKWTVSTIKCKLVDCSKKSNVANAKLVAVLTTYQAKARFVCLPGYYSNKASGETVCQVNKSWKKPKLSCQAPVCGPAPTKQFSTVTVSSAAINGVATYKCINNFEGKRGSNTIKCLPSKKWSETNFRCEIIKCDPPKFFVAFGKLTRKGKTAEYTCSKGFFRIGNGTTSCLYNGTWTDPRVRCKAVNCGNPKAVPNMKVKYILTKYLYNATYKCDIGFKATGSGLVTCQKDGKWSNLKLKCGIINCGQPKFNITNSILKVKGTIYRSGASYTCKKGHFSYGHGEIACRSDGYWTKPSIVCISINCGKPASVIGRFQLVKYNKTYYAATAKYGCKPGYKIIPGSLTSVHCLRNGKWSRPLLKCKEVLCPAPPVIKHATVKISNSRPKGVATYVCEAGYETVNKITNAVCQISGIWTKPTGSCKEINCGKVPVAKNAKPSYTKTTYKSTVKYSCSFGFYSKVKVVVSVCQANKTWSVPDITCSKSKCGIPTAYPNVDVIHDKKDHNRASYKCSKGFKQTGGSNSIVCQKNGAWTKAKPICKFIDCGKYPPAPTNSSIDKQPKNSHFKSAVVYKCNKPLTKTSGSYSSICMEDGKWSKLALVCGPDPNYCKNPVPTFPNGRALVKGRAYGARVSYACDIGYRIIGRRFSQCLITGKWSDPKSKCQIVNCGKPPALKHANVIYRTTLLRSVAQYRCKPGFKTSGITKVVCTANGRWTVAKPCVPSNVIDCGKPPKLALLSAFVMGKTTVGTRAFYRCVTGYRPNPGTSGITICLRTGVWSKPTVECKAIGK